MSSFFPYVSAAERRKRAAAEVVALRASGQVLDPVVLEKASIASTFWGRAWCKHLESFSDYASRLPRGRTYVRNGAVVHLAVGKYVVEAKVTGGELYSVRVEVDRLARGRWQHVIESCAGQVSSVVELLEGKLSSAVMAVVTDPAHGLFPTPDQISLACSCPDRATLCKHVAAALYGVGARLDRSPELLFVLRGVDPAELLAQSVGRTGALSAPRASKVLPPAALAGIFGIELVEDEPTAPFEAAPNAVRRKATPTTAKATPTQRTTKGRAGTTSKRSPPS